MIKRKNGRIYLLMNETVRMVNGIKWMQLNALRLIVDVYYKRLLIDGVLC